jgi:oligopeptide/dipeptide ABC transporter ATP-binding protein
MTTLLEAREVTKSFGGGLLDRRHTIALRGFSLALGEGRPSVTAVVGESGSGKTTLARLLLGLLTPTEGRVAYRGRDLTSLSRAEWRTFRREVQAVFQDPYEVYNPFYRVDHVLTVPVAKFGLATSRAGARALIENALRAVGLRPDETLGRFPHQLSGGQRQRVMVARALLLRPRVILADEPVSMVDASLRATILGALRQMTLDLQIPVIYITHDLATAYQIAENIVVLYRGAVVEAGDVELVVKDPRHPYTQLLIGSIPLPGIDRKWAADGTRVPASPRPAEGAPGCLFEDRCPSAMPACRAAAPPLFRTEPRRVVSCFLYRDAPELPAPEMTAAFIEAAALPGSSTSAAPAAPPGARP